ncbi:MAG TPA: N(4)-(beta-N-acetylglucosaminyl)-L-asparaginase [Tepidisphaeraceae bacterium]|nr:N(4)-(beta-N-acetylglucosaminyl)-L-asparaginase [Tepidisphaeraceae bacterium]
MTETNVQQVPIVISTWPFGMPANEAAWEVLRTGGLSLDAVETGITFCEDDPSVDSVGWGGLPDSAGEVTLDASIMDHTGRCGAVACLHRVRHAIRVARMVMELTPHVMLAGESATRFALDHGLPQTNLLAPTAARAFDEWRLREEAKQHGGHDTIGMLAIDARQRMAGGCSTSGLKFKLPGRVGDSPIIGAGLYVLPGIGAAAATGKGEEVIKVCGSFSVVQNMSRGLEPREAIAEVLKEILHRHQGKAESDVSFIALRADGAYAGLTLRPKTNFQYAVIANGAKRLVNAGAFWSE